MNIKEIKTELERNMKKQTKYLSKVILSLLLLLSPMQEAVSQETGSINKPSEHKVSTIEDTIFEARGLVRSAAKVEIRSDVNARIISAPFQEGMAFKKGDILIKFDCSKQRAELKAAKASANAAWIELKTKKKLLKHQAVGRKEVEVAAANANEANAQLEVHRVGNKNCKVQAPFSGRVVKLYAQKHELPAREKPLLTILNDGKLILEMVVPSRWLTWIEIGTSFEFFIDETQQTVSASISRLGAEIDPVSQTISVVGKLNAKGALVLSGMSGKAVFSGGG